MLPVAPVSNLDPVWGPSNGVYSVSPSPYEGKNLKARRTSPPGANPSPLQHLSPRTAEFHAQMGPNGPLRLVLATLILPSGREFLQSEQGFGASERALGCIYRCVIEREDETRDGRRGGNPGSALLGPLRYEDSKSEPCFYALGSDVCWLRMGQRRRNPAERGESIVRWPTANLGWG